MRDENGGVEDVMTIHISRRAVRTTLLVLAAFLVLGFVVPFVLMNVDAATRASSSGRLFRLASPRRSGE
jgi:hypothetical protein